MKKINCTVDNCSHNSSGSCNANRVDIGGSMASTPNATCCGSFLDKANYSDLTSNTNTYMSEPALVCSASNCCNNENKICTLQTITISSNSDVKVYSETFCKNFC